MTDAAMEEKFCLMARKQLPAGRTDQLLRLIWGIDNEARASNLIAATRV